MMRWDERIDITREVLWASLETESTGLEWCSQFSDWVDSILRETFQQVRETHPILSRISLVATGGYGRRELSPYSDVDLVVIPWDDRDPNTDIAIRALYNAIHHVLVDRYRMQVDYAYRLVADAPALDPKSRTALLESRVLAGSDRPYERLMTAFWESFPVGDFLIQKIQERRAAHAKAHSTPLVVTPELKEGAGGLRDFHTASWIRQALGERALSPNSHLDRVLAVRNQLHRIKGKNSDRLTHAAQAELRPQDAQDREWMAEIHRAMLGLHDAWLLSLERVQESRFSLTEGVISVQGEARLLPDVSASRAAVGIAHAVRLGMKVTSLPQRVLPTVSGNEALRAISWGGPVVRAIDRCGVLEALLPELCACRTLLPDDHSHVYTVFEHSLRAVDLLTQAQGSREFFGELLQRVRDPGILVLALLLHDVGKIDPDRPHAEAGAEMAERIAQRWGLDRDRTEHLTWLVRDHLELARLLRMRDVRLPETAEELAARVQTVDRLVDLSLLTWADTSSVGPETWTATTEAFLKELFVRTEKLLASQQSSAPDPEVYRQVARRKLGQADVDPAEVQRFTESLPAHYLLTTTPDDLIEHYHLAQRAALGDPQFRFAPLRELHLTELTVACLDSPGLLSRVLGLVYSFDISVVGVRACTTRSEPAIALDVFNLSWQGGPVPQGTLQRLQAALMSDYHSESAVESRLEQRGKAIDWQVSAPQVELIPGDPSLLEVQGRRGYGLAYRMARHIARQGWNILGARVGQWADRSTASFTVYDAKGQPLQAEEVARVFKLDPN